MIKQMKLSQNFVDSLVKRYQFVLETSMEGNECILDWVDLLCYKSHKINLNCGGICTDCPD